MPIRALYVLAALWLLFPAGARAQGDLRRVRNALHPPPRLAIPNPGSSNSGSFLGLDPTYQDVANSSNMGGALASLAALGVVAATSPFWGPHELYDAGFAYRGWFPRHPHVADDQPYMLIGNYSESPIEGEDYYAPLHVKPWALRISADVGDDFDNLGRIGGQLFLDTSIHRLGLLANVNYYRERLVRGTDDALMTDVNLTWRVTQSSRLLMHLGGGVRTWTYDGDTDAGINGLYRADWFPINQLHAGMIFEAGTLNGKLVLHGQAQVGFHFSHGELFVGYDFLRIKDVNLQGPLAGLRLWF